MAQTAGMGRRGPTVLGSRGSPGWTEGAALQPHGLGSVSSLWVSNTTGLLWCCSWPQLHSEPGQLLEAKGLDLPLLLIPVPDRAFPKGRARFL